MSPPFFFRLQPVPGKDLLDLYGRHSHTACRQARCQYRGRYQWLRALQCLHQNRDDRLVGHRHPGAWLLAPFHELLVRSLRIRTEIDVVSGQRLAMYPCLVAQHVQRVVQGIGDRELQQREQLLGCHPRRRTFHQRHHRGFQRPCARKAHIAMEPQPPLIELWHVGQRVIAASMVEA